MTGEVLSMEDILREVTGLPLIFMDLKMTPGSANLE